MTEMNPTHNFVVDRREETVVTQQPGYSSTEQLVHDVAAERRLVMFQINRIVWTLIGILEILFAIRFVLRLIAANPNSGFTQFIYGITGPFLAPFTGLTATPASNGMVLEVPTLIAMAIYALFAWIVLSVLNVVWNRPSARVVTRSVHEQGSVGTATTPVVVAPTTTTPTSGVPVAPGTVSTTEVNRTTVTH